MFIADSALASVGALLFAAAAILSRSVVKSAENNMAEWAGGMLDTFFEMSLPVFAVLFVFIMIPAFLAWWDTHSRTGVRYVLRSTASVFASALILLLGGFYSVTVKNTSLHLEAVVYLASFGEALLFRALYSVEYRSHILNQRANVKTK
ncbi:MAG: hypothetical protein ACI4XJ_11000 [Eubacteriales bacterium]